LIADPEHPYLDLQPGSSLDHLQAASITYRIAIGPHTGRKALTLCSVPPVEVVPNNPLLVAKILGHVQQREALNEPLARAPPGHHEHTADLI